MILDSALTGEDIGIHDGDVMIYTTNLNILGNYNLEV